MKILNLQEFAESLMLGEHREFAIEILDNLDFVENSNFLELCEDIRRHSEKEFVGHEPLKQIDRIRDRLNLLDEIKENLVGNGFLSDDPFKDTADLVNELAKTHFTITGLLRDKGLLADDGDILESVMQLLDRVPQYDL